MLADGREHICPKCHGHGHLTVYNDLEWAVNGLLTIGEITVSVKNIEPDGMFDNIGHYTEECTTKKVSYMAYETGIGSGAVYDEDLLFPTDKQASAECDRRNAKKGKKQNEN